MGGKLADELLSVAIPVSPQSPWLNMLSSKGFYIYKYFKLCKELLHGDCAHVTDGQQETVMATYCFHQVCH